VVWGAVDGGGNLDVAFAFAGHAHSRVMGVALFAHGFEALHAGHEVDLFVFRANELALQVVDLVALGQQGLLLLGQQAGDLRVALGDLGMQGVHLRPHFDDQGVVVKL